MINIRYIIIAITMFPVLMQAQTFKHSIFAGPNFSYYSSSNSVAYPNKATKALNYWNFGGCAGYKLEYYLPKTLTIGVSIEYLLARATLYTPCYCPYTTDRTVSIRNTVSTHNIDIPIYFKLKTNNTNYTYFTGGFGINWLFSAHRKVESVVNILHQDEPSVTEKVNESFTLQNSNINQFGTFYQIGIGQKFKVKKINFFTELSYRQDINSWLYNTIETPDGIKEFPIKRQSINLKFGVFIKNKIRVH